MIDKSTAEDLKLLLTNQGFKKRGNAYFRVIGDGVLQNIKFQYERVDECHILYVGIHSLYGELLPQRLTSSGCIPNHCIFNLLPDQYDNRFRLKNAEVSAEEQVKFLRDFGINKLNTVTTQKALADFMCQLDKNERGKITWNDMRKFAPFLACENYDLALRVLSDILVQHYSSLIGCANDGDTKLLSIKLQRLASEDDLYIKLHYALKMEHFEPVTEYLSRNYSINSDLCRTLKLI